MKKTSVNRMLSAFRDIPVRDIALAQTAYNSKDAQLIKQALNKPNISDASAIGLGNLANQYIKNLNAPKPQFIKSVKSITKVELTTDYKKNLENLGNEKKIGGGGSPPIPIDAIEVLSNFGELSVNKFHNYENNIKSPNSKLLLSYFMDVQKYSSDVASQTGLKEYRLFIECQLDTGNTKWISTTWNSITNRTPANILIGQFNRYLYDDDALYTYLDDNGNVGAHKIISFIQAIIEYR